MSNRQQKIRLTESNVLTLPLADGKQQSLIGDTQEPGLFLRITAGSRSYVFEKSLKGKTIRMTLGGLDITLADARSKALALKEQIREGHDPRILKAQKVRAVLDAEEAQRAEDKAKAFEAKRKTLTLADIWPEYIAAKSPKWGEYNKRDHELAVRRPGDSVFRGMRKSEGGPLAPLLDVRLSDLTAECLSDWLIKEGAVRPTSTARAFRLLRACLRWASSRAAYSGLIPPPEMSHKSTDVTDALPEPGNKSDALRREMLPLLFDALRSLPNRQQAAFLQIQLLIGCRPGELLSLRWDEVDTRWGTLTLRDKDESKGGRDGVRLVPFGPYVGSLLAGLHKAAAKDANGEPLSPFVFPGRLGGVMSSPNGALAKVTAAAGIGHLTLHGLRRSYASLTEWLEWPVGVRAQIMGHKASATAEKHYVVRPLDLLHKYQDKFEAWVLSEAGVVFDTASMASVAALRGVS